MVKGLKRENLKGRNFALTIILGVFIAIMLSILFNLVVSYFYEAPKYEDYCSGLNREAYPLKYGYDTSCQNCTFSKTLQEEVDACTSDSGMPVYEYDDKGCTIALKECDMCSKQFEDATKAYNRSTFFIFAAIGLILIIVGLFFSPLLKNFDDKLYVIITFALLIAIAVYLALKKLR